VAKRVAVVSIFAVVSTFIKSSLVKLGGSSSIKSRLIFGIVTFPVFYCIKTISSSTPVSAFSI
jgi:hypothetical protein